MLDGKVLKAKHYEEENNYLTTTLAQKSQVVIFLLRYTLTTHQ